MLSRILPIISLVLALTVSVFAPPNATAGEESADPEGTSKLRFKTGVYQFRDSEDFDQRYGHIWTEFFFAKKFFLRANATRSIFTQDSSEFGANGVDFELGTTFGAATDLIIGAGLTGYDSTRGKFSKTDFSYQGSIAFKPIGTGHLTLAYDHEKFVNAAKSLGALRELINSDEFRPSYYQWISERWSVWAGFAYGMYSDDNSKMSLNGSVTFLFRPEPSFGLSYAFGYTTYEKRSELYWDPEGYQSHNLILWLQQPLGKYFSFEFRGSPGYSTSENEPNAWADLLLDIHPSSLFSIQVKGHVMGNPARDRNYSASEVSADLIWTP